MKNELLTIGPFTVYGYGLMIAIGIVAGCLTAEYRARKQSLDSDQIFQSSKFQRFQLILKSLQFCKLRVCSTV